MKGYMTLGLGVLAGAALIEVALVPGVVIGGAAAAVLAPRYLPRLLRRSVGSAFDAMTRPRTEPTDPPPDRSDAALPLAGFGGLRIKQAVAKTITFRIIVTTLDFSTNYVVIGELATAAGLSAFNLVVGPLFYLAHETAWNYFGPSGAAVGVSVRLPLASDANTPDERGEFTISRPLAKTITFRTIATVMDFTANYVAVADLATAAGLTAFAFVVGPFVYLGHEKVWDYYSSPSEDSPQDPPPVSPKLLPAPG
jgi:uncharacterized membrane protein